MFHVAITLIMHLVPFGEPILGENICQNFIKISIPPSASCKMSKTSTQNLGNCFQSCVVYNGSSNMISRNAYTTECLCCQDVPSEDVFSSGNWISYSFGKSSTLLYLYYFPYMLIHYKYHYLILFFFILNFF